MRWLWNFHGQEVPKSDGFCYHRSIIHNEGRIKEDFSIQLVQDEWTEEAHLKYYVL